MPLIDRKRRLADLIGKAKRAVTRRTNCISQKLEFAQYACRSQRERRAKLRHRRTRAPLLMKA